MGLSDLVKQARDGPPPTMGEVEPESSNVVREAAAIQIQSIARGRLSTTLSRWGKVRTVFKFRLGANNKIVSDKRDGIVAEMSFNAKMACLVVYMIHNFWNCWVSTVPLSYCASSTGTVPSYM